MDGSVIHYQIIAPLCHVDLANARYKGTHTGAHKSFRSFWFLGERYWLLTMKHIVKNKSTSPEQTRAKVHVKVITANNILIGHCLENALLYSS